MNNLWFYLVAYNPELRYSAYRRLQPPFCPLRAARYSPHLRLYHRAHYISPRLTASRAAVPPPHADIIWHVDTKTGQDVDGYTGGVLPTVATTTAETWDFEHYAAPASHLQRHALPQPPPRAFPSRCIRICRAYGLLFMPRPQHCPTTRYRTHCPFLPFLPSCTVLRAILPTCCSRHWTATYRVPNGRCCEQLRLLYSYLAFNRW